MTARLDHPAPVVWFTGLSGSGKTTIGRKVCRCLEEAGHAVEYLDGDAIRAVFPSTGFSRAARDAHIRRVAFLASRLQRHGVIVVVALVSPYADSRAFARKLCAKFVEVYVSTPFDICESRDVKGLYAKARRGEIANFTGLGDPYEPPECPELTLDTRTVSINQAAARVLAAIAPHLNPLAQLSSVV